MRPRPIVTRLFLARRAAGAADDRGLPGAQPDVAVAYEDLQTADIYDRIVRETDAGEPTADFAFSSSMDLQMKLANDGYAQPSHVALSASWPRWANWRNTAYALTYEPAVFIYHKPSFAGSRAARDAGELLDYLEANADAIFGRIGTYDIERSGVGFMFFSRDQEQYADLWTLVGAMGAAGVKLYSTTSAIVERVADGQFVFGYNILGSYAAEAAARNPDLGIVLPRDFTIVTSRIGLVPKAAANPDLGRLLPRILHVGRGPDDHGREAADRRPQPGRHRRQHRQRHATGARQPAPAGSGQPRPDGLSRPGETRPPDQALERRAAAAVAVVRFVTACCDLHAQWPRRKSSGPRESGRIRPQNGPAATAELGGIWPFAAPGTPATRSHSGRQWRIDMKHISPRPSWPAPSRCRSPAVAADYTIMAPAAPGGGWDQTARSLQEAMTAEGISGNVQVVNVPGAGGTIGLAQFAQEANGDPTRLMVGGYVMVGAILTNKSPVTLDAVTPIARLTGEYEVIVVPAASDTADAGRPRRPS